MGNLIKVLGKDLENCPHFFLDFESKSCEQGGCGEGAGAAATAALWKMGTGTMSPSSPVSPGASGQRWTCPEKGLSGAGEWDPKRCLVPESAGRHPWQSGGDAGYIPAAGRGS